MHGADTGDAPVEPVSQQLILKVTVELTVDESDTILVHAGDNARALSAKFCKDRQLPDSLVDPLRNHILQNLKRIGASEVGGKVKPAVRARETATHCPSCGNVYMADSLYCRSCGHRRPSPMRQVMQARDVVAGTPRKDQRLATQTLNGTPRRCQGTPRQCQSTPRQRKSTPRQCQNTPPQTGQRASADVHPRFIQLHQDSLNKKIRMQRLRQQVEADEEQRCRNSIQVAPGTMRYAAWHRRPEEEGLGERLYRDAAQRQLKIRHLQAQQEEQRRLEEEREATFKPAIEASQRHCQGTSKSLQDPEGLKRRMKIERLKNMQDKAELDGCTFKPEIDQKSEELISQRLARLKITGNLYDSLYEDAIRRKERQIESLRALPPGVTFRPDIGVDHYRPPNDDTREDFLNRLAYSKSYSERWISLRRQAQEDEQRSQDSRSQAEFRPVTGRGPLVERNKGGLPIGDFLYEMGREKASASQQAQAELERSQPSTPRMGETSRQLFEETKRRKYRLLFDALVSSDAQGMLRAESVCLENVDDDVASFLQPMVDFLKETSKAMDFGDFCAALDYQRQQAKTPTAHLFLGRTAKSPTKFGKDLEYELSVSVPKIDPNSQRIASRRRTRSVPLHEQLFRERDVRDARLEERRLLAEEQELQECTFRPNLQSYPRSHSAGTLPTRSRSAHSLGRKSSLPGPFFTPQRGPAYANATPCSGYDSSLATPRTPLGGPGGPGTLSVAPGSLGACYAGRPIPQLPRPTAQETGAGEAIAAAKGGEEVEAEQQTTEASCPRCGNVFMEDAVFCRKCGQKKDSVDARDEEFVLSSRATSASEVGLVHG
eukprot:TRINITY_DN20974_c0_g1_i1.p1 TRINITY_DN20974_c0_g1~~TRINITY_DN20974_c0_g1_i1.p1  ORF type:complete len:831 (+),score=136.97 TRINITY_DN20974_c0_g1_i1:56-2548(+)